MDEENKKRRTVIDELHLKILGFQALFIQQFLLFFPLFCKCSSFKDHQCEYPNPIQKTVFLSCIQPHNLGDSQLLIAQLRNGALLK